MMIEALDIIEAIWTKPGPFTIAGEFWKVDMPAYSEDIHGPHLKPHGSRAPRIAMTGMQSNSPTLTLCGERGYLPISQQVSTSALIQHRATYERAAHTSGHTPDRRDWRVLRDYFVADTDEEAMESVINGPIRLLAGDEVDPAQVTVEWLGAWVGIAEVGWCGGASGTLITQRRVRIGGSMAGPGWVAGPGPLVRSARGRRAREHR
jgi:alkanesulfonate monooxygenase SsuD/methylene tetrahydromethanopterin reductase-like flavin-dependent oxidoreductase (luciferase family)